MASFCVVTFMPASAGVVQEAGKPRRPSICTVQIRQDPKASKLSDAHSLGILISANAAARNTEVPSGTVTSTPSISSVTKFSDKLGGVP